MSDRETFKKELDERTKEVNALIEGYLPEEAGAQKTIFEAMNYSMRAGGKRLRPLFMQEMCRLFTGEVLDTVKPFMAAVEMIHTSSLVHDDLPCMDDDMMRRGKASTWAEYGEDIGVLTGDALMIYAMETASKAFAAAQDGEELARVGQAMEILARKTGPFGMIGGQTVDVELAGGPIPKDKLDFIYRLKTGALIEASMLIGAVLGGAADQDCRIVESLASKLGMAFQIQDDILDVEELAMNLLDEVRRNYPELVASRYKLDQEALALPPYELMEAIGRKRGLLIRGGEVNTERCAIMLVDEFRACKWGRITLERPPFREDQEEIEE